MTRKQLWTNIIAFTILPVAIASVIVHPGTFTNVVTSFQNTTVWWLIQSSLLLVLLYSTRSFFDIRNSNNLRVVQLYLIWNIFSFSRGLFIAENYWEWKGLIGNTMALLLPIVAYVSTNKAITQSILSFYVKYTLPLFFIVGLLISTDAYGFYLVPISFLMLFFPVLTKRWKIAVGAFTLFVILIDFDARSNVIKFLVPVLLLVIYYYKKHFIVKRLEIIRLAFIIAPMLFFLLAASGLFNVFRMDNYIEGKHEVVKRDNEGQIVEYNLKADTRTFLYSEVLFTAKKYNNWWLGRSPARGNLSEAFGEGDLTGRGERMSNEVAVLNIFTWTGIIGLVLYFFVFYKASYIAINNSNNTFSKMLGIFIAFRWTYSWVEDVNDFSLNYYMLWLMIGLCFSKSFRAMTDDEVTHWARSIFTKKRRLIIFDEVDENESESDKYSDENIHSSQTESVSNFKKF